MIMTEKKELLGLDKKEIEALIAEIGEKPFRAKQLWQWIYYHGETDFDRMTKFFQRSAGETESRIYNYAAENRRRTGFAG